MQSAREHFRHGRRNPFAEASVVIRKRAGLTLNLLPVWRPNPGLLEEGERE